MQIWTSSWFTKLPPEIARVGISRGTPRNFPPGYRKLPVLAPGPWFKSVSPAEYHERYMAQLARIDVHELHKRLWRMTMGGDIALVCYEAPGKPDDWCHRGQVSAWLWDELSLKVYEYGHADEGCGWRHPKLHHSIRHGGEHVRRLV